MTVYEDEKRREKKYIYVNKNYNVELEKDDTLHVVTSVFSPYGKEKRTHLTQEFINRFENLKEKGHPVNLYVVELLFPNQESLIKMKDKENHLQIHYSHNIFIFNKENLINVGVEKMLPNDWKWFAWIDADIEFLDEYWVEKTIQLFKKENVDMIQLFSICRFLNANNIPSQYFYSSMFVLQNYKFMKDKKYRHPGFAWACSRNAYGKMGGLFDYAIVGGGDMIMECCLTNRMDVLERKYKTLEKFIDKIKEYHIKVKDFKLGFLNNVIQHYYHGERGNRLYVDRNQILIENDYDPNIHLIKPFSLNNFSFLIPVVEFYEKIESKIQHYFLSRKET